MSNMSLNPSPPPPPMLLPQPAQFRLSQPAQLGIGFNQGINGNGLLKGGAGLDALNLEGTLSVEQFNNLVL